MKALKKHNNVYGAINLCVGVLKPIEKLKAKTVHTTLSKKQTIQ